MATIRTGGVLASALALEGITEFQPPSSTNQILENNNINKEDASQEISAADCLSSSVSNSSNSNTKIHHVNTLAVVESQRCSSLTSLFNRQSSLLDNEMCCDSIRATRHPSDILINDIEIDTNATDASVIDKVNEKESVSKEMLCEYDRMGEIIKDDTRNNINVEVYINTPQETLIDMDEIQVAMLPLETEENNEVELLTSTTVVIDQQLQQPVETYLINSSKIIIG